jgi:hypothetical protein
VDTTKYRMVLSGSLDKPSIKLTYDTMEVKGAVFTLEKDLVGINFDGSRHKYRLSGYVADKNIEGKGQLENGTVVFIGGKITAVGKSADINIDKKGYEVIDVTGKQVYPGLIFPNTSLGLVEIGNGVDVATDNREIGDLNPNVRAIVAYNTDSQVIPVIRSNGILIAQIVPVSPLLPGTSSVVQLDAWNWEDAAYKTDN